MQALAHSSAVVWHVPYLSQKYGYEEPQHPLSHHSPTQAVLHCWLPGQSLSSQHLAHFLFGKVPQQTSQE